MTNSLKNLDPLSLVLSRQLVLEPKAGCSWASEMVLNPAILEDPETGRIHMLFRATGPYEEMQTKGKPLPFPIFLGYAYSDDKGKNWSIDFSRPALAPRLAMEIKDIYIKNTSGQSVVNHSNGCIEDPRWFWLEGSSYLVVACRMFSPGPYWINDEPTQCAPEWAKDPKNPFGRAASENVTVNVMYRVNLAELRKANYEKAFEYVTHITDPKMGENRDVLLFPEKLTISGKKQFVMLHRPWQPQQYPTIRGPLPPSMVICAASKLEDLATEVESQRILAAPMFEWEKDRIGASAPVLKISDNEWLLCHHGKQDTVHGYSQSFMILESPKDGLPTVKHRLPTRVLYPVEQWEMPGRFKAPVVFITGMIQLGEELMVSYGAADQKVGIATLDLPKLIAYIRSFDSQAKAM